MTDSVKKPHIALFINSMRKGGAERVMANLAEYLYSHGWKVTLVTTWFDPPEYELPHAGWDYRTGKMKDQPGDLIQRIYSEPAPELVQGSRLRNFKVRYQTIRDIWVREKPDLILSFIGMTNIMAILTADKFPLFTKLFGQNRKNSPSITPSITAASASSAAADPSSGDRELLSAIPVVISVRSTRSLEYNTFKLRFLADHVYPRADGVVFQTDRTRDAFPASIRQKAVILPNSVNPAFMQPRFTGIRDKVIVSVGRLDENKNQAMLIRAFARVKTEFPAYQLQLYGDGPAKDNLVGLARAEGLTVYLRGTGEEALRGIEWESLQCPSQKTKVCLQETPEQSQGRISATGTVDTHNKIITVNKVNVLNESNAAASHPDVVFEGTLDDIPNRIRSASVYVLCSRIEGMPNSLIEAMSLGLACISTDCEGGGPASLIENGLNGYLIPSGDEQALETRLRYLLANEDEIDRIGQNAVKVQQDYNPDIINARWETYLFSKVRK